MSTIFVSKWFPIDTAPKDGTRVLFAGQWSDKDSPSHGKWTTEIFGWGSIHSDGDKSKCEWWSGLSPMRGWAVDWTHWMHLPDPPG